MQTATLLSVTVGVLTGLVGFVMGVLMQQDASYRGIHTAMENDPYIYRKRKNIFKAVSNRDDISPSLSLFTICLPP